MLPELTTAKQRQEAFRKRKETLLRKVHDLTVLTGADAKLFLRYGSQMVAYNHNRGREWPTLDACFAQSLTSLLIDTFKEAGSFLLGPSDIYRKQQLQQSLEESRALLRGSDQAVSNSPCQPNLGRRRATVAHDPPKPCTASDQALPPVFLDTQSDVALADQNDSSHHGPIPSYHPPQSNNGSENSTETIQQPQSNNTEGVQQSPSNNTKSVQKPPTSDAEQINGRSSLCIGGHSEHASRASQLSYQDKVELVKVCYASADNGLDQRLLPIGTFTAVALK